MKRRLQKQIRTQEGFTLIEIIVVMVILAIASLVAIPMFSSGADIQIRSAANKIAADLDYAKGLAVTHQENYTVVFDSDQGSYQIQDAGGTVIQHPMRNDDFKETLSEDRLSRVDITSADFDGDADEAVTFDYLGAPYSGIGTGSPLMNSGRITLQADSFTLYVKVEPVTGYVTISDTP